MDWRALQNLFEEVLFPYQCLGCGATGSNVCRGCAEKIILRSDCSEILCACPYQQELVKKIIFQLKYGGRKNLAPVIAVKMVEYLERHKISFDREWRLCYVPMTQDEEQLRGFNQSELIACELAEMLELPVLYEYLAKIKNTPAQKTLDRTQRLINLKGAFAYAALPGISLGKILLIDDVHTTGSTFAECTRILKAAGALEVRCFAFAQD